MNQNRKPLSRRSFAQLGFGLAAAAALAACGGGGGDGDGKPKVNLREAFDKIQYRMTKDQVRAIVGRHEDDESNFSWGEGGQDLKVDTQLNDNLISVAVSVRWKSGSQTLIRSLFLGE